VGFDHVGAVDLAQVVHAQHGGVLCGGFVGISC
jgi:hypothetical protein